MNFFSKVPLPIGVTIGSVAVLILPVALQSNTEVAIAQIAQTLAPEEVNLRAKQIIVRIDGASLGSGSLIDRSDNIYTVLTNWHVVQGTGDYTIQTVDGRKHQIDPDSIKRLPGLDLAVVKFASQQNYQIAELGDSSNLTEGQNVYFAGYPGELRQEDNRYYRFFTANLVGILPKSTENGYSLIYSGEAFPGMSGGPVFNKNGLMIGVHGEANIHAVSGGTSNYGIPINSYQQAIAKLNSEPANEPQPAASTPTAEPSEVIVDSTPEPVEQTEPDRSLDSDNISSVPTFSSSNAPESTPPETESDSTAVTETATASQQSESTSPDTQQPSEVTAKPEAPTEEATPTPNQVSLVSSKTGIDYTKLRNLLKAEKWSEADLHTDRLVEQIVKTAKQQNKHVFIELKTIAEFSCPDIRTIDSLWKEYSNNKFGFSPQQEVWQSVNQQGDFSTQTWRRFATEVGWKEGEVNSGSGYLLYEQLDFEPTEAPAGHLPWWFALPEEEQNVIKYLFVRCNLNRPIEEREANKNPNSEGNSVSKEPSINKVPKPFNK